MEMKYFFSISLVVFLGLMGFGGVVLASKTSKSSNIFNKTMIVYSDLAGNSYQVQSNIFSIDTQGLSDATKADGGIASNSDLQGSIGTPNTEGNEIPTNLNTMTTAGPDEIDNKGNNFDQTEPTRKTTQSSNLKPWALWFIFGFVPLFMIGSMTYLLLRK